MTGRAQLINTIPGIEEMSYLELGVEHNQTFDAVLAKGKESVDKNYTPTYKMTTDKFFSQNTKRYDVILIDACHEAGQVLKDYNNAIKICNRVLLIHDMVPPNKDYTRQALCGDGYKLLIDMVKGEFNVYPCESDFGLTMILPPFQPLAEVINHGYDQVKNIKTYGMEQLKELLAIKGKSMAKRKKVTKTAVVDGDLVPVETEEVPVTLAEKLAHVQSLTACRPGARYLVVKDLRERLAGAPKSSDKAVKEAYQELGIE